MQQPDKNALLQLLSSPAGQQLVQFLSANGGNAAREAARKASIGDVSGAKQALAPLMEDPQLRDLMQQLGGTL